MVVPWILGEAATATLAAPRISARACAAPRISARPRDLCGPARPRLLCAFMYPHRRAARVLAPARAGGNRRIRAVHSRVRPCLRAPPLLICGLLC